MKPIWGMLPTKALNSVSRGSTQRAVRSKKSLRNGDLLSTSFYITFRSAINQHRFSGPQLSDERFDGHAMA
jgi:hypothetical protein